MNTIRVSYSLDPDQAQWFIGLDLGPNCLQTTKVAFLDWWILPSHLMQYSQNVPSNILRDSRLKYYSAPYWSWISMVPLFPRQAGVLVAIYTYGSRCEKTCLQGLRTTKVQISQRIWTLYQHLCYFLNGKHHIKTCYKQNFKFLASLCSSGGCFGLNLVGNPKDRFSRIDAHIKYSHLCSYL